MPHGLSCGLVLGDYVLGCHTCVIVLQWGSILRFGVMRRELVPCHLVRCRVHIGVVVLVDPGSASGLFIFRYAWGSFALAALHLEVVDLVEWWSC